MSSVFLRDQQQINKKEIILVINCPCICKEDKPLIYFVSQPSISKSPSNINKPVVSNVQLNSNVCIKMCWIYMWHFSKTNKQKRLLLCFKKKKSRLLSAHWERVQKQYFQQSLFSKSIFHWLFPLHWFLLHSKGRQIWSSCISNPQ